MPKKKEKGKRLSTWIGQDQLWIEEMLEKRVQCSEVMGVPSSVGHQVRAILVNELRADFIHDYGMTPEEANESED